MSTRLSTPPQNYYSLDVSLILLLIINAHFIIHTWVSFLYHLIQILYFYILHSIFFKVSVNADFLWKPAVRMLWLPGCRPVVAKVLWAGFSVMCWLSGFLPRKSNESNPQVCDIPVPGISDMAQVPLSFYGILFAFIIPQGNIVSLNAQKCNSTAPLNKPHREFSFYSGV